ncbi:MAG: family 1 glycosylhydrolase, partial [Candidatus Gribaldobacteria bacterium]|nr:family 1 glycosylhydrolase [Candidatus Gribaldobacteria bacterium]
HGWAHERAIAGVLHKIVNSWIIEHTTNDFIGVNYYLRLLFDALRPWRIWGPGPRNDIGWEINAPSLTKLLLELKGYNIPLIITENGIADATDSLRGEFIRRHIEALTEAMKSGVNCLGYYHWTPFDNFEWDQGFGARFGLIKVDFETQERTVRPSAYVYRDIIRT